MENTVGNQRKNVILRHGWTELQNLRRIRVVNENSDGKNWRETNFWWREIFCRSGRRKIRRKLGRWKRTIPLKDELGTAAHRREDGSTTVDDDDAKKGGQRRRGPPSPSASLSVSPTPNCDREKEETAASGAMSTVTDTTIAAAGVFTAAAGLLRLEPPPPLLQLPFMKKTG
ncbi:hypothetical protein PIB30_096063 [Stylosanthes scabra]|uniref:Uncharacterized protein n=1 Tax=Stylosanthes scabra TaxID=79078 RepID=A0ABU6TXZ1_9FABA|nr:hypothetical protein [Stylosanthes scabra]